MWNMNVKLIVMCVTGNLSQSFPQYLDDITLVNITASNCNTTILVTAIFLKWTNVVLHSVSNVFSINCQVMNLRDKVLSTLTKWLPCTWCKTIIVITITDDNNNGLNSANIFYFSSIFKKSTWHTVVKTHLYN